MNREEINEMMPIQRQEESLTQRVFIGTMFVVFLVLACMMPDFLTS